MEDETQTEDKPDLKVKAEPGGSGLIQDLFGMDGATAGPVPCNQEHRNASPDGTWSLNGSLTPPKYGHHGLLPSAKRSSDVNVPQATAFWAVCSWSKVCTRKGPWKARKRLGEGLAEPEPWGGRL